MTTLDEGKIIEANGCEFLVIGLDDCNVTGPRCSI